MFQECFRNVDTKKFFTFNELNIIIVDNEFKANKLIEIQFK